MNYYRKHKGIITLTISGTLALISVLALAGSLVALGIITGAALGSVTLWLTGGIKEYPRQYMDIRDTD